MRLPRCTSLGSGIKVVFTRVESPRIFAVVIVNFWPARNVTARPEWQLSCPTCSLWRATIECNPNVRRGFRVKNSVAPHPSQLRGAASKCADCAKPVQSCKRFWNAENSCHSRRYHCLGGVPAQLSHVFQSHWPSFRERRVKSLTLGTHARRELPPTKCRRCSVRDGELIHQPHHQVDAFRKSRRRNSLVVSMHALNVFLRQRERHQSIRLYIMQTQLGRIRRPG